MKTLTQEPETIKAFRDTWELGIHSYLVVSCGTDCCLTREMLDARVDRIFVQINR